MNINGTTRALVAATALGLTLTACSGVGGDPTTAQQSTAQAQSRTAQSRTAPPSTGASTPQTEVTAPTIQDPEPSSPTGAGPTVTQPASDTSGDRPGSGHGLCFDLNSKLSQDSIATLGTDSNGGQWQPAGASNHPLSGGCGLDWMQVNGSGFNDATYTSRVLLFANGTFLGTVEPHEFSYTSIAGSTLNSVTVRYRWLRKDDPFCCPQGGPSEVTVTLSGGQLSRTGEFPPETS